MKSSDIPFCDIMAAYYTDPENVVVQYENPLKKGHWVSPDGKCWAFRSGSISRNISDSDPITGAPSFSDRFNWRIKPKTITINGIEVPAPETVAPQQGAMIWIVDPTLTTLSYTATWSDVMSNLYHLVRGLVHLSEANAIAHAEALILASGGNGKLKLAEARIKDLESRLMQQELQP